MFPAERGCREIRASSIVRADAQSCAHLESPRTRDPYRTEWEFSPATVLRTAAQSHYRTRYPGAYVYPPYTNPSTAIAHLRRSPKNRASPTTRS